MELIISAQWWGRVLSGSSKECYSNHSTLTLEFLCCLVFLDDSSVVSCSSGIMSHFFFLDAQDY